MQTSIKFEILVLSIHKIVSSRAIARKWKVFKWNNNKAHEGNKQ